MFFHRKSNASPDWLIFQLHFWITTGCLADELEAHPENNTMCLVYLLIWLACRSSAMQYYQAVCLPFRAHINRSFFVRFFPWFFLAFQFLFVNNFVNHWLIKIVAVRQTTGRIHLNRNWLGDNEWLFSSVSELLWEKSIANRFSQWKNKNEFSLAVFPKDDRKRIQKSKLEPLN